MLTHMTLRQDLEALKRAELERRAARAWMLEGVEPRRLLDARGLLRLGRWLPGGRRRVGRAAPGRGAA